MTPASLLCLAGMGSCRALLSIFLLLPLGFRPVVLKAQSCQRRCGEYTVLPQCQSLSNLRLDNTKQTVLYRDSPLPTTIKYGGSHVGMRPLDPPFHLHTIGRRIESIGARLQHQGNQCAKREREYRP